MSQGVVAVAVSKESLDDQFVNTIEELCHDGVILFAGQVIHGVAQFPTLFDEKQGVELDCG